MAAIHMVRTTATSIDATQRKLILGIVIATLMALAIVIAALASGGRPDPPALRAAATLLDGSWRFHTGDDPHWADANTDDSGWETVDMTALPGSHDGDVGLPDYVGGWMAHGHPGYHGYAWYRRAVAAPAGRASWDRGRCCSPFPPMRRALVAFSPSAHTIFPVPGAAQTAAACTAGPYWLR